MPVYMIRLEAFDRPGLITGPVKIGFASNPDTRLNGFQSCHYQRAHMIRLFEGSPDDEKRLHARFDDLRLTGDWFRFSDAMLGDVGLVEIPPPTFDNRSPRKKVFALRAAALRGDPMPEEKRRVRAPKRNLLKVDAPLRSGLVSWAADVCREPFPCNCVKWPLFANHSP